MEPANRKMDDLTAGIWARNPVFVQLLGMCPVLAVSNSAVNALAMGLATSFVLVGSAVMVSLLRRQIPKEVRIATFIVIIASFVTLADLLLQAFSLEVHRALGPFVSLIVVNCIILGQAESFASQNPVFPSLLDALGRGVGFTVAIVLMGSIRELIGQGSWFEFNLLGANFQPWTLFILPSGGFFTLGLLLLVYNRISQSKGVR